MRYFNKNTNNNYISKLISKVLSGITSILENYSFLFNEEELKKLVNSSNTLTNVKNESIERQIAIVSLIEEELKEYAYRCFSYEKDSNFISWLKDDNLKDNLTIISSTFSNATDITFCDSKVGIKYDVPIEGFIAACEKDAATLVETPDRRSIYTIGEIGNKVINSYNFATPIITPKQVFDTSNNEYMSKHNEIILDAKSIRPISIVCLDNSCIDIAKSISERYNIPIENLNKTK